MGLRDRTTSYATPRPNERCSMEFHGGGAGGWADFSRGRASRMHNKKPTVNEWPTKYPAGTRRHSWQPKTGDTNERSSMGTHMGGGGAGGSAELSVRASMEVGYAPVPHHDDCSLPVSIPQCFPRTWKWHWLLNCKKPVKLKGLSWRRRSFSICRRMATSEEKRQSLVAEFPGTDFSVDSTDSAADINEEWYIERGGRPSPSMLKQIMEKFKVDDRCQSILPPYPTTWAEKVVTILHMVRCRELTEPHSKYYFYQPTRFCDFNIAFFDLDKESELEHSLPLSEIPPSKLWKLDDSVNIISIQISRSGIPDPIHIYGTVLARDQNDYRCVYLFKRGRDEPQLITRQNRTLALTGPYRALGGSSILYFEFHLKIKGKEEADDEDFSKGLITLNLLGCECTPRRLTTLSLDSCLSIVDLAYMYVPCASEASVGVSFLNGGSDFMGKICAWTSGDDDGNKIILYDSEVAGTKTKLGSGGSVSLSRSVVSVRVDEDLVLGFCLWEGNYKCYSLMNVGHNDEGGTLQLGPYELQVNVIWRAVVRRRIPKMWKYIKHTRVLW